MKLRIASTLLALALPAFAQQPAEAVAAPAAQRPAVAAPADYTFLKAFYLEKGERSYAQAITLYREFLAAHPEHDLAPSAARQTHQLLLRTGKHEAADAFAKEHAKLLAREVAAVAEEEGDAPAGGPGARGGRGRGGRFGPEQLEARLAELKKELEQAKEAGDDEAVARLEGQIQRLENAARGRGQGRGPGGRRGFFGDVKFAEMDEEQMERFLQRLDRMAGMVDRIRESGNEERAEQLEEGIGNLKKALAGDKTEEAQKIWDKLIEGMRRRR